MEEETPTTLWECQNEGCDWYGSDPDHYLVQPAEYKKGWDIVMTCPKCGRRVKMAL